MKQQRGYNTLKALTKTQQHEPAVIEDSSGNILMENKAVRNQWTEYCSGLYNYELHPDTSLLQSNQTPTQEAESLPVLIEEVEETVCRGSNKSPDSNMPEDLGDKGMAEGVETIARHTSTKETLSNVRTIVPST